MYDQGKKTKKKQKKQKKNPKEKEENKDAEEDAKNLVKKAKKARIFMLNKTDIIVCVLSGCERCQRQDQMGYGVEAKPYKPARSSILWCEFS